MNKPSFTPGPWEVTRGVTRSGWLVRDRRKFFLATTHDHLPGGNAEIDANARMIAAAPEMFEALKVAYELIDRAARQCDTPACWSFEERDNAREMLSAALSRAGEAA